MKAAPLKLRVALSAEVHQAMKKGAALVALETSVVAHGLAPPHNLDSARACEQAVRDHGAVPATIGVIDGVIRVGLTDAELEHLAEGGEGVIKAGSAELSIAVAKGLSAGTTVSATCEIAGWVGIPLFSTGGIGGVHRGPELDVSQDLAAIARAPVGIVCAGAKSVLDVPKTLEMLETLGVPVLTVGSHDFPGFFTRDTGLTVEHSVANGAEAAAVLNTRFELGQGGVVIALPPDEKTSLSRREVERFIEDALAIARKRRITGKAVTPFLLSELASRTRQRTVKANLALLQNNAAFAAQTAVHLARLPGKRR